MLKTEFRSGMSFAGGTSPAAILLITDSLSLIIGFGSTRASNEATWSGGIANVGAKWRELRVRRDVRWSNREKSTLGVNRDYVKSSTSSRRGRGSGAE